jgi:hypothetical protein
VLLVGLALPILLVACGVTESSGTRVGGTNSSPSSVHTGPLTTPSAASRGPSATGTSGKVTLLLDKTSYAPGSAAIVTIENGLSSQIVVTDHHTSCTYVQLEQQVAGQWQQVGKCRLMTPTRLVDLPEGSATPQRISIPTGPEAAGTYRVTLRYSNSTAYSTTFTVG